MPRALQAADRNEAAQRPTFFRSLRLLASCLAPRSLRGPANRRLSQQLPAAVLRACSHSSSSSHSGLFQAAVSPLLLCVPGRRLLRGWSVCYYQIRSDTTRLPGLVPHISPRTTTG